MATLRGHWREALVVLVGLITILAYVVVSGVVNEQPPTQSYPGWLAVLQPAGEAWPEQMQVMADAVEPGAPGKHPALRYAVLACGNRPFHGILLIGGQARLDHAVVMDEHGDSSVAPTATGLPEMRDIPDVVLGQEPRTWHLGAVQMVPITIDQLSPCAPPTSADQRLQTGTGDTISGFARAPIQRTAQFAWVPGPRSSLVWPLVGGLPGIPPGDLGEFHGIRGLSGDWSEPPTLRKEVSAGSPAARVSVDLALPALADATRVAWDSALPLRPSLRITDVDAMATWQQWLVIAAIGLGIGGSLLASLLFEWTRRKRHEERPASGVGVVGAPLAVKPRVIPRRPSASVVSPLLVAGVAFIAYVLGRSRR